MKKWRSDKGTCRFLDMSTHSSILDSATTHYRRRACRKQSSGTLRALEVLATACMGSLVAHGGAMSAEEYRCSNLQWKLCCITCQCIQCHARRENNSPRA